MELLELKSEENLPEDLIQEVEVEVMIKNDQYIFIDSFYFTIFVFFSIISIHLLKLFLFVKFFKEWC